MTRSKPKIQILNRTGFKNYEYNHIYGKFYCVFYFTNFTVNKIIKGRWWTGPSSITQRSPLKGDTNRTPKIITEAQKFLLFFFSHFFSHKLIYTPMQTLKNPTAFVSHWQLLVSLSNRYYPFASPSFSPLTSVSIFHFLTAVLLNLYVVLVVVFLYFASNPILG